MISQAATEAESAAAEVKANPQAEMDAQTAVHVEMMADFEQEKKLLKAAHKKDLHDAKLEVERANHLQSTDQRLELQNLRSENRHLNSRNEDGEEVHFRLVGFGFGVG